MVCLRCDPQHGCCGLHNRIVLSPGFHLHEHMLTHAVIASTLRRPWGQGCVMSRELSVRMGQVILCYFLHVIEIGRGKDTYTSHGGYLSNFLVFF